MATLVFRAISSTAQGVTFAELTNPDHQVKIGAVRQNITRNGVTQPLIRVTANLVLPLHTSESGCVDGCAPKGIFTRSVRIETSSISMDKAALIKDLNMLVSILESNDGTIFDGFTPSPSADISYVEPTV